MATTDRRAVLLGAGASAALLAAGGIYLARRGDEDDRFAQCRTGNVAGGMDAFGTDFTLTRQDGQRVTAQQVFDKPSLLYFGYTFCPDVCPLDSARNAEVASLLADQGQDVQTIFVTVDPVRDTPAVITEFTAQFPGEMIGLTGSEEEIAAVNKGWRNYFKLNDEQDKEFYLVDHMTNTYLVMPGNRTVSYFTRDAAIEPMADEVRCFLKAAA